MNNQEITTINQESFNQLQGLIYDLHQDHPQHIQGWIGGYPGAPPNVDLKYYCNSAWYLFAKEEGVDHMIYNWITGQWNPLGFDRIRERTIIDSMYETVLMNLKFGIILPRRSKLFYDFDNNMINQNETATYDLAIT